MIVDRLIRRMTNRLVGEQRIVTVALRTQLTCRQESRDVRQPRVDGAFVPLRVLRLL